MGKRGQKRLFPKRYASDFINTSQRPRAIVTDRGSPEGTYARADWVCSNRKCRHRNTKDSMVCTKCQRENPRVSYDHWFDNQSRVRTVTGPAHDKTLRSNNSWNTWAKWRCPSCGDTALLQFTCKRKECRIPGTQTWPRAEKIVYTKVPETLGRARDHYYFAGERVKADPTPKQENAKAIAAIKQPHVDRLRYQWVATRGQGVTDYYPYPGIGCEKPGYILKLFFSGNRFIWLEQENNLVSISVCYPSKERALQAWDRGVSWIEAFRIES